MSEARKAIFEAWSSTELLSVSPEFFEHFHLYKVAKEHFLNNDFIAATEYCLVILLTF